MRRENGLHLFSLSFYLMLIFVAKIELSSGQTTGSPAAAAPATSTTSQPLRIAVPVKKGFKEFVKVTNNCQNFSGFAIEVFKAVVSSYLPKSFTYEFVAFSKPDCTMNGTYDDMLQAVYNKDYDGAVGDIVIQHARSEQWVKFTTPYLDTKNGMLVRVENNNDKVAARIYWFRTRFIIAVLAVFLITALVFCVLDYIKKKDDDYGANDTQLMHRETMTAIRDTRVVMVLWFSVLLLLTTCYVASLTSLLVHRRQPFHPRNLSQLRKDGEKVGYSNTSFIRNILTSEEHFPEEQIVPFESEEEMQDLLSKGTAKGGVAAVVHRTRFLQLFLAKRPCDNQYVLSSDFQTLTGGYGFAFQKDSPWTGLVSDGILELIDNGQLAKIQDRTVGSLALCEDDTSIGVGPDILVDTATPFIIIAGIACFGFVLAILYAIYLAKMCR